MLCFMVPPPPDTSVDNFQAKYHLEAIEHDFNPTLGFLKKDSELMRSQAPISGCGGEGEVTGKRLRALSSSSTEESEPSFETNSNPASQRRDEPLDVGLVEPAMTMDRCRAEARQYNAMSKFQRWSRKAYRFAVQNDCLDDICAHLLAKGNSDVPAQITDHLT